MKKSEPTSPGEEPSTSAGTGGHQPDSRLLTASHGPGARETQLPEEVEEENDEEEKTVKIETENKAPDGGYGWMIVFGSFMAHIVLGGLDRSDGIFFLKLEEAFKRSAQATAWIASLSSASRLMFGPVASAFSNRFSSRAAAIVGGLLVSVGFLLSMAAPQLEFLYFSFSLVGGLGRSFAYTPCLVIVGLYFNKRRGLAVGLATAGVGVGTLMFPPVIEYLFEVYSVSGAFLLLSAISLHLCVCGTLYRPLHKHLQILEGIRKEKPQASQNASAEMTVLLKEDGATSHMENDQRAGNSGETSAPRSPSQISTELCNGSGTRLRKRSSFQKLRNIFASPSPKSKDGKPRPKLLDLSLLRVPCFVLYCISIAVFTGAFKVGFTFLPALAKSKGCTEMQGALLMSIAGVIDTIGRITAGFLLDLDRIRPFRPLVYNGVIFAVAGVAFLCPFASNFIGFAVLSGFFGLLTGTYVSQKSVIIVDILGVEKLTSSFGLLIFFQGLGSLLAPPIAGALKDLYGQYNEAFYLGGGLMVLAAILMTLSNILRLSQLRKERKAQEAKERGQQEDEA